MPKTNRLPGNAFRWIGSKARLMTHLLRKFPDHRRYVSVFGGSGADILRKPPSETEVFNDLSADIVNVFHVLRDEQMRRQLCIALEFTPYSRLEYAKCLNIIQSGKGSLVDRAWAFLVCTTLGYGPQDPATVSAGTFAVKPQLASYGRFQRAAEEIIMVARRFRKVIIENLDWKAVIAKYDAPDTFFYLDPPYVWSSRVSPKIYAHEMEDEAHSALLTCLHGVKGLVMLSGYANPIYDNALKSWRKLEIRTRCTASPKKKKPSRTEIVWMNYDRHGTRLVPNPITKGEAT